MLIVVGAPGMPEYGAQFQRWADSWQAAAVKGAVTCQRIGLEPEAGTSDRDRLRKFLSEPANATGSEPLWLVLIGHGTYDGREARFNLRGPDFTGHDLSELLAPVKRPVAIINCTSGSAPFINHLSGPGRIVITSTRSGHELNFAHFGQYLAAAIADPAADLDKDGQVSLLEAFLTANNRVAEFYKTQSRLATEHALLDDNGDKLGTQADWFQGVRAVKRAKDGAAVDGIRAHQLCLVPSERERAIPVAVRKKRDELELSLAKLRDQKGQLGENEYFAKVEPILIELARLYKDTRVGR
jgi:hypothetical protein